MLKLWLRIRQYLAETRSLRSINTVSWPDTMKLEAKQDGFDALEDPRQPYKGQ